MGAGLKSYSDLFFSTLEDNGISYVETVEMEVRVYDNDNWTGDYLFDETVTLTVSNTTTDPSTFEITSDSGFQEVVLADESGVRVTAVDFDADYWIGPSYLLRIENNADGAIMVSADNVAVNGYMCDPFWATEVMPGKSAYSHLYWNDVELENSNIESVETVTFDLRAYNSNTFADILEVSCELGV